MKIKLLFFIPITLALIFMGSSCKRGLSEKDIHGTWDVTNWQERSSNNLPWNNTSLSYGQYRIYLFQDHRAVEHHKGVIESNTYYWSYDKSNNILKYNGTPYTVEEFSGSIMVLSKNRDVNSNARRITLTRR